MENKKALSILPNFTIVADKKDPKYYEPGKKGLAGRLLSYCDSISSGTQADVFKITPESIWQGMNTDGVDFINFLKENSENIPEIVLNDIIKYSARFGVVTLIGDDCLQIKEDSLLKEVLNCTDIKSYIYSQEGNLLYFDNILLAQLQKLFIKEIGYPIKIHQPKVRVFYIKLAESTAYTVKACSPLKALRTLYNKHSYFNEESLRKRLKLKREINEEDILKFMDLVLTEDKPFINMIHETANYDAVRFIF